MDSAPPVGSERGVRAAWRRARQRWWVRWGVDLVMMAAVFLAITAWQTRNLPGGGTPAPDFQLRTLGGEQVRLADLRGKPTVLVFWAPWCGVCKAESSTVSSVRSMVGERAHVLTVAVAYRDEQEVRRFVQQREADYPVLLGNSELQDAFRVTMFPTTFVLSSEGRIQESAVGYTTHLGFLWRLWRAS